MGDSGVRIRTLVVDDEQPARELIRSLLAGDPEIYLVGECASGIDAVNTLMREEVDLLFLDIQMPGLSGFEALRRIPVERLPIVVFVTAFDEFALQAFEAHALDYLLKPFARKRFRDTLDRAKQHLHAHRARAMATKMADMMDALEGRGERGHPPDPYRFVITRGSRMYSVLAADVSHIESADHYVSLMSAGKSHLLHESISHLEERLAPHGFVRVHRTKLVNTSHVREVRRESGGGYCVVLTDRSRHRVSRQRQDVVRRMLPPADIDE